MSVTRTLERIAKAHLSPPLARLVKRVGVYPRYLLQAQSCRKGFGQFGHLYAQKLLFIAGLPKSGTTWMKRMVASYPGFDEILIPDVASYELSTGGSHDYDLPPDIFARFNDMLVITKMHVHGSLHNVRLLRAANIRYVVLYRDLRDVAISHFFYARQTPWHPEYPIYANLSVHEGLEIFGQRTLQAFARWVRSWHENRDPEMSLEVRYERMLSDTAAVMTQVAEHFELDSSPEVVEAVVKNHSFLRLSEGRQQGQQSSDSFFRKGIAGDWRTHFTPHLREIYKKLIGDFLVEFGYERDLAW